MNPSVLGIAVIVIGVLALLALAAVFVLNYGLNDDFHKGGR